MLNINSKVFSAVTPSGFHLMFVCLVVLSLQKYANMILRIGSPACCPIHLLHRSDEKTKDQDSDEQSWNDQNFHLNT